MIWITIILGLIQAVPAIIEIIKLLLAAIHGTPNLVDRAQFAHTLEFHLLNWHLDQDHAGLENNLRVLAKQLNVTVP